MMAHPTLGPKPTQLGAIALYNLLFDLATASADRTAWSDAHGITVDRIDSIPDSKRGAAGIYHCDGRAYVVSVMPMPGIMSPGSVGSGIMSDLSDLSATRPT
jgi:hypothetical protein